MGFRKNLRNRVGNTVGVVPRSTVGTGLYTISDATKTAIYGVLNPIEGVGKTATSIKEAVHNAFTNGKWYHKLWKAPASLLASPFMAIEGVAETLWGTSCNIFRNTRDTIAHPFINVGHSIKWMGSAEGIGDFKFTRIDNRSEVNPRNRLASLFGPTGEVSTEKNLLINKEKHLKEKEDKLKKEMGNWKANKKSQEDKLKKEMETRQVNKKNQEDKYKKEMETRLNDRKNKENEYIQTLKKERDAFNKEKEEFNKRISLLEQEKKELESTLKNSETVNSKPKVKKEVNEDKEAGTKKAGKGEEVKEDA